MAALNLQRQLGDVAGLARSTATLAELCMRAGQFDNAIALLANAITLNVEKGSPIGLAFNRHTLGALAQAAAQAHGPDTVQLQGALADIEGRLALAQSTATLSGTVTDAQGGVMPGAAVVVHDEATGAERSTVSDSSGEYRVPSLPPGEYRLEVRLSGFQTSVVTDIRLEVA